MITFIRTGSIAAGKNVEAIQFAKKVIEFIKTKHDIDTTVRLPIGGNPFRVSWVSTYESLADYERKSGSLLADPEYMAMIAAASGLFIAESMRDEVWRSV